MLEDRKEAAMVKLESAVETLHNFIHGPETDLVPTESGNVPTLSRIAKLNNDSINSVSDLVVTTTETIDNLPTDI